MNIGLRFKRIREARNLTQKEAAERIGIQYYQLGNYETNRSEPSIATLKKMSEVYNTTIDNLVGNSKLLKRANEDPEIFKEDEVVDVKELIEKIKNMAEKLEKEVKQ